MHVGSKLSGRLYVSKADEDIMDASVQEKIGDFLETGDVVILFPDFESAEEYAEDHGIRVVTVSGHEEEE